MDQPLPMLEEPRDHMRAREAARAGDVLLATRLLGRGLDVDARVAGSATMLMLGSRANRAPLVEALLAAGADPELIDNFSNNAAMIAAERGADGALAMLISAGARIEEPGPRGTALVLAAAGGKIQCLRLLLAASSRRL